MIKYVFSKSLFKTLIFPYLFFLVLVYSYGYFNKLLPVSYWDEVYWVDRSNFFVYFINGDFGNEVWKNYKSFDQPKLAEYAFGAWLYPIYLLNKAKDSKPIDYNQFLIKNGFYFIQEDYDSAPLEYKSIYNFVKYDGAMIGYLEDWVAKYGIESRKTVNLILYARILNVFLLSGAVIIAYFLALKFKGFIFSIIFSILYGYNSLIIETGLKAYSEALFLLTFNASLYFMVLYFEKNRNILYLILFSLFSSLCMSTKLNGSFMFIIFTFVNTLILILFKEKKVSNILWNIFSLFLGLVIFVGLNPFTYSNPFKNIKYMFEHRNSTAIYERIYNPEASIERGKSIKKIFENFYFSGYTKIFNGIKIFNRLNLIKNYGVYLFLLFLLGMIYTIKLVLQKYVMAIIIITSFLIILLFMNYYLILDWMRYYVHLSFFFTLFQLSGLFFLLKYILKYMKYIMIKIISFVY